MRRLAPLAAVALGLVVATGRAGGQGAFSDGAVASEMTAAELEDEIARREADLARHGARLARLEASEARVRDELAAHAAELGRQESQVRARIVTLCRLRQGGYLHILRGASSWTDLVRRARYARTLAAHDLEVLRRHHEGVQALETRRRELDERLDEARGLRDRIAGYRDELRAELERRASPAPGHLSSDDLMRPSPETAAWIDL